MTEDSKRERKSGTVNRRDWVRALGVAGVGGVAGCLGDDDDTPADDGTPSGDSDSDSDDDSDSSPSDDGTGDDDSDSGEGEKIKERFERIRGGTFFPDIQWNPIAENSHGQIADNMMDISAILRDFDNELDGVGLSDWNYDGDSRVLTMELRDDLVFQNGDQFTAEDFWVELERDRLINPEASQYESIEIADELTLELTTKEAQNAAILVPSAIVHDLGWGMSVWGEWTEQLQDASNQDERDSINQELTEWTISTERLMDERWCPGPWRLTEITETYVDYEAFKEHRYWQDPDASPVRQPDIEQFRVHYSDERGRSDELITNEIVDIPANEQPWEEFEGILPDHWEQFGIFTTGSGRKLLINWRNKDYLQDFNFRRAMAAALDFENIALNTGKSEPYTVHNGLSPQYNRSYWDGETDQFIDYGSKTDLDLADEYLSRSGYTREDGAIYNEDDEELEPMHLVYGSGTTWGAVANVSGNQLAQAGFPIEMTPVTRSRKIEIISEEMDGWDLSTETHYQGLTGHPAEYFRYDSFWGHRVGPADFPPGNIGPQVEEWLDEGLTHSPFNDRVIVATVPEEVGQDTLDGSTQEVNFYELWEEIQTPTTEERDREIVQTLSWAHNFLMPDINGHWAAQDHWGNTQPWDWVDGQTIHSYGETPHRGCAKHKYE